MLRTDLMVLRTALRYGHQYNPKIREDWGDYLGRRSPSPDLSLHERDVIASWQDMMGEAIEPMIASYRPEQPKLTVDGIVGPATLASTVVDRCGMDDYGPRSAPSVVGSGSWSMPCQKEMLVWVDRTNCPYREQLPDILSAVRKAWRDVGWGINWHVGSRPSRHYHIRVTWEVLPGSVIGLAEFNNTRCNDRVFCKLDPGYQPTDLFDQICNLLTHELAHNNNQRHTRGGIMNPSMLRAKFVGWKKTDPSWPRIVETVGGKPIDKPDDPDDPDDPPRYSFPHDLTIKTPDGRSWIVVPRPEV